MIQLRFLIKSKHRLLAHVLCTVRKPWHCVPNTRVYPQGEISERSPTRIRVFERKLVIHMRKKQRLINTQISNDLLILIY